MPVAQNLKMSLAERGRLSKLKEKQLVDEEQLKKEIDKRKRQQDNEEYNRTVMLKALDDEKTRLCKRLSNPEAEVKRVDRLMEIAEQQAKLGQESHNYQNDLEQGTSRLREQQVPEIMLTELELIDKKAEQIEAQYQKQG